MIDVSQEQVVKNAVVVVEDGRIRSVNPAHIPDGEVVELGDVTLLARASRSKRSRRAGSPANASGSTLIATVRPSRASRALYTLPPAPMGERIS